MVRFDGRILTVAFYTLLLGCGRQSHQPEPPAVAPSPAVQSQPAPAAPAPEPKAEPKKSPKDSSDTQQYPWPSGPIAEL